MTLTFIKAAKFFTHSNIVMREVIRYQSRKTRLSFTIRLVIIPARVQFVTGVNMHPFHTDGFAHAIFELLLQITIGELPIDGGVRITDQDIIGLPMEDVALPIIPGFRISARLDTGMSSKAG
jgi:hypothetical protein